MIQTSNACAVHAHRQTLQNSFPVQVHKRHLLYIPAASSPLESRRTTSSQPGPTANQHNLSPPHPRPERKADSSDEEEPSGIGDGRLRREAADHGAQDRGDEGRQGGRRLQQEDVEEGEECQALSD